MATQVLGGTKWWLRRRDDMTVLRLEFLNITLATDPSGSTRLTPTNATAAAQLTVYFPPQAVLEQAYTPDPNHPGQVFAMPGPSEGSSAQFSGESKLVLDLPPSGLPIQFTAAGLLAWAGLVTDGTNSALECVWGLAFRPANTSPASSQQAWLHSRQPDISEIGATALWHTSLMWGDSTGSPDFSRTDPILLRATATTEQQDGAYLTSLTSELRTAIGQASLVAPLSAREVTLSALGATIDLSGRWNPPQADGLVGYKHRAVLGRDEHVHTVQRGYLLPFGFPAQLSEVTTRICEFADDADFGAAILSKTGTLVILDQLVTYPGLPGLPKAGRQFPFRTVRVHERIATVSSSALPADPNVTCINEPGGSSAEDRYQFHLIAEDYGGNTIEFTAPAYFVGNDEALSPLPTKLQAAIAAYDAEVSIRPSAATGRIGLATESPGDTMADITAVYLGAVIPDGQLAALVAAGHLGAFPRLFGVDARIPAIDALSPPQPDHAVPATATPPLPQLQWPTTYLTQGLGVTGLYAQLTQPVAFLPPSTNGGGLASLNTPVIGLSQKVGLVGGPGKGQLDSFTNGFDPAKFFPDPHTVTDIANYKLPSLLGFIDLSKIVGPATFGDGNRIPQITTALLYGPNGAGGSTLPNPPTLPTVVRTSVSWRPFVVNASVGNLVTTTATALEVNTTTTISLSGGGPPVTDVRGVLSSFDLNFVDGLVTVTFDSLAFTSHAGAAPKLDVKIAKVAPGGNAFAFFQQLLDNLPGAGDIPQIDYRDNSLVASYSLAIPSIPMGAFLMQNLAVSSSVTLPLDGRPVQASFAFASREHPFLLTVSLLGGGGFLALTVVGETLQELEAQLDFGAAASLDLIVASASVSVTAGIHLAVTDGKHLEIDGFFRATGQVDLLGIISVSLEIYLALEYDSGPPKKFRGTAEFTVRIQVAFFSQSLSFSVSRSFSAGADPTFDIAFPSAAPWQQRCAAFAPMVAS
jgi:hypothetical protein